MFGSINPYGEHPHVLRRYKRVDSEVVSADRLPITIKREGDSLLGFLTPLIALYIVTTYTASLYSPMLFLGWLIHGLVFVLLGFLIYHLCPPKWWEHIELDEDGVTYERFGVTRPERWRVPLTHYRGVVPVKRVATGAHGEQVTEFGVALKHPDPTKTIILYLSPAPPVDRLMLCAEALNVRALSDPKHTLSLSA